MFYVFRITDGYGWYDVCFEANSPEHAREKLEREIVLEPYDNVQLIAPTSEVP